jgi:hypothetical protein
MNEQYPGDEGVFLIETCKGSSKGSYDEKHSSDSMVRFIDQADAEEPYNCEILGYDNFKCSNALDGYTRAETDGLRVVLGTHGTKGIVTSKDVAVDDELLTFYGSSYPMDTVSDAASVASKASSRDSGAPSGHGEDSTGGGEDGGRETRPPSETSAGSGETKHTTKKTARSGPVDAVDEPGEIDDLAGKMGAMLVRCSSIETECDSTKLQNVDAGLMTDDRAEKLIQEEFEQYVQECAEIQKKIDAYDYQNARPGDIAPEMVYHRLGFPADKRRANSVPSESAEQRREILMAKKLAVKPT